MEDEKGLVAREWLYTKVFGVDTVQWIVTTMTIEMVIMANS